MVNKITNELVIIQQLKKCFEVIMESDDPCNGLVVRASPREWEVMGLILGSDRQVFKTGSSGFPPWHSGLWE